MSVYVPSEKSDSVFMYDVHDSYRGQLYGAAYLCLSDDAYSKILDFTIHEGKIHVVGEEFDQHQLCTIIDCVHRLSDAYPDCVVKTKLADVRQEHAFLLQNGYIKPDAQITKSLVFI